MRTNPTTAQLRLVKLAIVASAALLGSRRGAAQAVPGYLQQIVQQNAPIVIEETDGAFQPNERSVNHLMRIDFDGDGNGGNNVANANAANYPNPAPAVYYSIVETSDAYFIGYYFYHIQDGGTQAGPNKPGHEHDLEGIWEIVNKSPLAPFGFSSLILTQAHGAMLPFYDPNWFSSPPLVGIPGDGQSTPVGMIHRWIDAVGVSRPVVAIRRSTHGTYMAQDCGVPGIYWQPDGMIVGRQPTDPYTACIHTDANAMIYVPETYPCSPAAGCGAVAVPQSQNSGTYFYDLVSAFDDASFWQSRQMHGSMFTGSTLDYLGGNQWGYPFFASSTGSLDANPPWAWNGGPGQCQEELRVIACWYSFAVDNTDSWYDRIFWPNIANGYLLTEPYSVAHNYFAFQNWSSTVYYNPFVGGAGSHPPALAVSIDGPINFNDFDSSGTWNADPTGGTPPYTYQWSGAFSGTAGSVSGTVTADTVLYLDVWDAAGVHVAVSTALTYCSGGQLEC